MIPKLNRGRDPLRLMIESKIDPWDIHKSKKMLRQNLKEKERLSHLEGKWNAVAYGTKDVIGTLKQGSSFS